MVVNVAFRPHPPLPGHVSGEEPPTRDDDYFSLIVKSWSLLDEVPGSEFVFSGFGRDRWNMAGPGSDPPVRRVVPARPPGVASAAMDMNRWLIDLSERSSARFFETPFEELTEPERVFVAVWTLEADVNNGGFDQYYLNSSGDHAWFAPTALRAIGAEQAAAIVEKANAEFGPDGPPRDHEIRLAEFDEVSVKAAKRWDDLDQAFYAYPDDLTALLGAYVQAHESAFKGAR